MNYPQLWRSSGLCFCLLFAALPASVEAATHVVRGGETFTSIARQHRISLATLQKLNPKVKPTSMILKGQQLVVPDSSEKVASVKVKAQVSARGRGAVSKSFSPASSLGAAKPDNAKPANSRSRAEKPAGKDSEAAPVKSREKGAITGYKVRKGDTLTVIADKNGMTVKQLMAMNRLSDSHLSVGQSLLVPASGPRNNPSPRGDSGSRDANIIDLSPPGPRQRGQSGSTPVKTPKKSTEPAPKKSNSKAKTDSDSDDAPAGSYYHIVKRHEDFSSIAAGHGVTWGQLARANKGVSPESLKVNQRLKVPGTQLASRQQNGSESRESPRTQTRLVDAKSSSDRPEATTPVRKPLTPVEDPLPPVEQADGSASSETPMTAYKVGPDDTIDSISKEFGTTPAALRHLNNMRSFDNPIPNGYLFVPWSAPSASAGQ